MIQAPIQPLTADNLSRTMRSTTPLPRRDQHYRQGRDYPYPGVWVYEVALNNRYQAMDPCRPAKRFNISILRWSQNRQSPYPKAAAMTTTNLRGDFMNRISLDTGGSPLGDYQILLEWPEIYSQFLLMV